MPVGYPTVKCASSEQYRLNRFATRTQKTLLPLVAVGGSLAGLPASALELEKRRLLLPEDVVRILRRAASREYWRE